MQCDSQAQVYQVLEPKEETQDPSPTLMLFQLLGFEENSNLNLEQTSLTKILTKSFEGDSRKFVNDPLQEQIMRTQLLGIDYVRCCKKIELLRQNQISSELVRFLEQRRQIKAEIREQFERVDGWERKFLKLAFYCMSRKFGRSIKISFENIIRNLEEVDVLHVFKGDVFFVGLVLIPLAELKQQERDFEENKKSSGISGTVKKFCKSVFKKVTNSKYGVVYYY